MAVIASAIEDAEGFRISRMGISPSSCSIYANVMPPARSRRCAAPLREGS